MPVIKSLQSGRGKKARKEESSWKGKIVEIKAAISARFCYYCLAEL